MDEFDAIRRFWEPLGEAVRHPWVVAGIGDDGAIVRLPSDQELVLSVDTLVEGVHFPGGMNPHALGWRALAVNLSDLAAMGATPICYTLALTTPALDEDWLSSVAAGMAELAGDYGIQLVGGDMTRGPLTLTLQVQGAVPVGLALRRHGARPGDLVCVSGTLGEAGAALDYLTAIVEEGSHAGAVRQRYDFPLPRLSLGEALRGRASAAVDISDGLLADLGHITSASHCGARIESEKLPLSESLRALTGDRALSLAATAGDDYELCFTWPSSAGPLPTEEETGVPITVIGEIEKEPGIRYTRDGRVLEVARAGYSHFSE